MMYKRIKCFGVILAFFVIIPNISYSQKPIDSLKRLSDSFYDRGNFQEAIRVAWKLVEQVKRDSTENSREYAIATGMFLSMNYEKLQQYDSAEYWYLHGIDVYRRIGDTLNMSYGETLSNIGNFYYYRSLFEKSIEFSNKALIVLKDFDVMKTTGEGAAMNSLANCYIAMGEYSKAEQLYFSTIEWINSKFPKAARKFIYATVANNLGALYTTIGNCKKANKYVDSAMRINNTIHNKASKEFATILANRSAIYKNCGFADSAVVYAQKAILIFEEKKLVKDPAYIVALNNLAEGYLQKKRADSAGIYFKRALEMAKINTGASSGEYLTIALNVCSFFDQQQDFKKADSLLQMIYDKIETVFGVYAEQTLHAHYLMASVQIRKSQYSAATATLQVLCNRIAFVLGRNFTGLSQEEKMLYMNTLNKSIGLLGALAMKTGNSSDTLITGFFQQQVILKRLILGQQQRLVRNLEQDTGYSAKSLVSKWKKDKQLLTRQVLSSRQYEKSYADSLEAVIELTEKEISRLYPELPAESFKAAPDVGSIISALKQGEAAIEFIHFDINTDASRKRTVYAAFILCSGMLKPLFIPLFDEQELLTLLGKEGKEKFSRGELVQKIYTYPVNRNAVSLYKLIWKPLEKYLVNYKQVFYSPTGVLNTIAMHAIPVDQYKFLCDKYQLRCVSSVSNIAARPFRNAGNPRNISLWGDFDYDLYKKRTVNSQGTKAIKISLRNKMETGKLSPIPFSKVEVESINSLFSSKGISSTLNEKENATEDIFKQKANGINEVLHISTHGFFTTFNVDNDDLLSTDFNKRSGIDILRTHQNSLLRCGLAFSGANYVYAGNEPFEDIDDGILTGYEISQLNLQHVQLLTLSACKTGVGDVKGNEGVFGLQRAFFIAGVDKILMSLWPVPDKETKEFMLLFYINWVNGTSINESLNRARNDVRKKYPHPFYWAGFVLME